MITPDDIAGAVFARVAATGGYATYLPGLAWFDAGPDAPGGYPYAVFKVEARPAEVTSGSAYVQAFSVRVAAYAPVGGSGVDVAATQQFLNTALAGDAALAALRGASLRNGSEKVLHARPVTPAGAFDRTVREGRDVFVCGLAVEVVAQGDRSVS